MPERLANQVPPVVVEAGVGIGAALVMVGIRVALYGVAAERAPYALNFLAIVGAAVAAGWRSGAIALAASQLLIWFLVVEPQWTWDIDGQERFGGFIIATLSQALILLVIGLYQREVDKGTAERERRMKLLDEALDEIDHRTRNNYQTVLAMIELQMRRATDNGVRQALGQVSDRIQAVSNASQHLAIRSVDIGAVRLDDHLCGLVEQIERGLSRDGIDVECEVESVTASADAATSISIIVNELVTNAIKHAFNGERPGRVSVVGKSGKQFELIVADNGKGIAATRRSGHNGLGTRLVESFARQLGAQHDVVSTGEGTTHRLTFPRLD